MLVLPAATGGQFEGRKTGRPVAVAKGRTRRQISRAHEGGVFDQTFETAGTPRGGANLGSSAKPLVGRQRATAANWPTRYRGKATNWAVRARFLPGARPSSWNELPFVDIPPSSEGGADVTATEFATELKARDLRLFRNRIVSDDCPGVTWKPVVIGGQIDRARTLRKVIRERRDEIVRQVRIGAA
jgi:hypothetical protein